MAAPKNLYALLVGINDYLSPSISNLNGTHKDLQDVHDYIMSNYEDFDKHIQVLRDKDAVRANVVAGFEQHLGQAQEGDVVLFYYSGHGSWGKTHQAFHKFDPDGREEVLVCHDSRVDGQFDLADKEIAVLLNYVARNNPEVVLLIDSCHSGSITKDTEATPRLTGEAHQERNLSDYLYDSTLDVHKNYYTNLLQDNGGEIPEIPQSRHLLMSACSERELARETREGGWFTQSLLKTLREQPELSYFQVYGQIFSAISQKAEKQTPQLEAYGLFNANNRFLTGERNLNKGSRFRIGRSEKNRTFRIDFGAQTGFPLDISRAINFNIYQEKDSTEPIGVGRVSSLGLVDSEIKISLNKASGETVYWGEILDYALAPVMICFEGFEEDLAVLNAALDKRPLQQVVFVGNDTVAPFVLAWDEKDACYRLSERQEEQVWNAALERYETQAFNRPVFILEFGKQDLQDAFKMTTVIEALEHLCQWKYTTELDNAQSRINKKDIAITFSSDNAEHRVKAVVQANRGTAKYDLAEANEGKLDYHKVVVDYTEEEPVNYSIRLENKGRTTYHLALAIATSDYGVIPLQSNIVLEPGQVLEEAVDEYYGSLSIPRKKDTNITNYLKVFISKQEISTIQGLDLPSLAMEEQLQFFDSVGDRMVGRRVNFNDWCCKTLAMNLRREVNTLGEQQVEIDRRGIYIHGHEQLKANVQVNSPERNTRSANQLFETLPEKIDNFELFFMDDGSGFPSETVLELTNIENEEALADHPLKISVPNFEDELVFPFTTETVLIQQEDGSYLEETLILPIGHKAGKDEQGNDVYEISELPTHGNKGTRSLGKALKMCFGKLFLSKQNYNLCWVDYKNGGERESEGVAEKVTAANKILVVLHGIIGDTGAMATNLEFVVDNGYYDLVLTYDYENLNTPIPDIATQFKKQLTEAGITPEAGKTVDIVAHSMGGLVSRTFIESPGLRGDLIVRNLYMLGTPNAGSAFAKIAAYRDLLTSAMAFALNFKTFGLSSIIQKVKGLSVTKNLTVTLEQMGINSPFLQDLNTNPAPEGVGYYILAGSTANAETSVVGTIAKLMDWATLKVGSVAYGKVDNDVAVSTESILSVPAYFKPTTERVDCNHMVYFIHEPTMTLLDKWMEANNEN
jgi:hypothetical protein